MPNLINKPTPITSPRGIDESSFIGEFRPTAAPTSETSHVAALAAKKPVKQLLTPLHCNIPHDIHLAMHRSMKQHELGKTDIVVNALRLFLADELKGR